MNKPFPSLAGPRTGRVFLLTAAVLLAGCAVGPDFENPEAPAAGEFPVTTLEGKTTGEPAPTPEQKLVKALDIPAKWWTLFQSKPLDDLIARAIKANPDLASAQAAIRVARENVCAAQGGLWPSLTGSMGATRQRNADDLSGNAPQAGLSTYNLYSPHLDISYSPDIFGANMRAVESLEAQDRAQRFQFEATYLTLTGNLVVAALTEAGLRRQIDVTREIIVLSEKQLESVESQYGLGQLGRTDVRTQESALAQLRATLPPLEKQLGLTRDRITALAGGLPSGMPGDTFDLDAITLPAELPVSLPAKIVEQRPDIRAAQELLQSACAQVGVAIANRLPNITLTAGVGASALDFNRLFKDGNNVWDIGGAVTAPIFDFGTLKHRQRAAEVAFDQAKSQYRSVVVLAFQNVSDSLQAIKSDTEIWRANLASEQAAAKNLEAVQRQFELGDMSSLAVTGVRQTYLNARVATLQAQVTRYTDTVALFQSLGGGWWNRTDEENGALFPASE